MLYRILKCFRLQLRVGNMGISAEKITQGIMISPESADL